MKKHVHCKAVSLFLAVFASVVNAEDVLQGTDDEIAHVEMLWSSTNHWLHSYGDYCSAYSSNTVYLRKCQSDYARQELRRWYLSIADLPLPSTNATDYLFWYRQRTEELASLAFRFTDVACTSCWVRAARYLHDIKILRRSPEDVKAEGNAIIFPAGGMTMESLGRGRVWFIREQSRQNALKKMDLYLTEKILDQFCLKGLPQLSEPTRSNIFGEIVRSAGFSQAEINLVTQKVEVVIGGSIQE